MAVAVYINPKDGNREVWEEGTQPEGHMTEEQWKELHPDPEPDPAEVKAQKLENLDASYDYEKEQLSKYYAEAMLEGDTATQEELRTELQELNEMYDMEREELEGE